MIVGDSNKTAAGIIHGCTAVKYTNLVSSLFSYIAEYLYQSCSPLSPLLSPPLFLSLFLSLSFSLSLSISLSLSLLVSLSLSHLVSLSLSQLVSLSLSPTLSYSSPLSLSHSLQTVTYDFLVTIDSLHMAGNKVIDTFVRKLLNGYVVATRRVERQLKSLNNQ